MIENAAYVTNEFHQLHMKSQLRAGDILVVRVGANRSDSCIVPLGLGRLNCANIVFARPFFPNGFLSYFLRSDFGRDLLLSSTTGSAQGVINTESVAQTPVPCPPLPTQRNIATILLAYDDLIENNLRRITILEEMGLNVYREWFIHFRFPGHERSDFGPASSQPPRGWQVLSVMGVPAFRFISENVRPYPGDKEYFATANVDGIDIVKPGIWYSSPEKPSRAQKQPVANSVWFARMRDTYKLLCFTDTSRPKSDACLLSSGFAGFEAPSEWFGFLYFTIKSSEFHEQRDLYATGATQVALTNDGLRRIQITVPDAETAVKFGHVVGPIISQISTLQTRNAILRQARDLLLPKLLCGELDVSQLDIDIGGAAA